MKWFENSLRDKNITVSQDMTTKILQNRWTWAVSALSYIFTIYNIVTSFFGRNAYYHLLHFFQIFLGNSAWVGKISSFNNMTWPEIHKRGQVTETG